MNGVGNTATNWCILLGLLVLGMLVIPNAAVAGMFYDHELSEENSFSADMLDFFLTEDTHTAVLNPALTTESEFDAILIRESDSLDVAYRADAEQTAGDTAFCDALTLRATRSGFTYDGPLLDFAAATTTTLGTWDFEIEFDQNATNFPDGAECAVDLRFLGWIDGASSPEESGFYDEERISLHFTANMVVMNEFLPRPDGVAYGFDFGDDNSDMPQGEWVELYNNSDSPRDLSGWYIWDASGSPANQIAVTAGNTQPATTTIPGRGWLVVYMNKAVLNNTGDDVVLYDDTDTVRDSYTYDSHDVCEHEPNPNATNTPTGTGTGCDEVPPNKSYARIPDGIGSWIDPVPTPGGVNIPDPIVVDQPVQPLPPIMNTETGTTTPETLKATTTPSKPDGEPNGEPKSTTTPPTKPEPPTKPTTTPSTDTEPDTEPKSEPENDTEKPPEPPGEPESEKEEPKESDTDSDSESEKQTEEEKSEGETEKRPEKEAEPPSESDEDDSPEPSGGSGGSESESESGSDSFNSASGNDSGSEGNTE